MLWQELSSKDIGAVDRSKCVVILPVGSVEQHGHHMPVGTDTILSAAVPQAAADVMGPGALVLAPPWYGLSAHHMHFPGTITLSAETMMALASDIVASVIAHGFQRIVIVNGHGGNGGVIDLLASTLGARFFGQARIATLT